MVNELIGFMKFLIFWVEWRISRWRDEDGWFFV